MTEPLDRVSAIHTALRNDMKRIDIAAMGRVWGREGMAPTIERFRFLREVLGWHARGEERGVFPVLEAVVPRFTDAYELDHRGLDAAFVLLQEAHEAYDPLGTARATAALRYSLKLHLDREDAHLYRVFRERVPPAEQEKAMGIMAAQIPRDWFPRYVAWLFPLLGSRDRENMARILQTATPAYEFAGVRDVIRRSIGNEWGELVRCIPALEAAPALKA
jgi:hypothetical protein